MHRQPTPVMSSSSAEPVKSNSTNSYYYTASSGGDKMKDVSVNEKDPSEQVPCMLTASFLYSLSSFCSSLLSPRLDSQRGVSLRSSLTLTPSSSVSL